MLFTAGKEAERRPRLWTEPPLSTALCTAGDSYIRVTRVVDEPADTAHLDMCICGEPEKPHTPMPAATNQYFTPIKANSTTARDA